jgi:adenylate cyclase
VRVARSFAFVDLSGFTAFTDEHGDEDAVAVLQVFRRVVRSACTDHAVRIAKWLGDGCMLVSVSPDHLVGAVVDIMGRCEDEGLSLPLHVGMAGGEVILLEGDDYTGRPVNLASRLATLAGENEILTTADLAALLPADWVAPAEPIEVKGFGQPVAVCSIRVPRGARLG